MNWGPACFALVWMFALFHDSDAQQRQGATTYSKVASVGGQQILECNLRYPDNRPLKYIVTWRKDGIKDPILIKYYHYPPQIISNQYKDRLALMNEISLIISPIRSEDQGWYECGLTFIDDQTEITGNGTWIYLTVHSPPRIVSSSPPTLQYRRGGSVVLSCEGTGNPEPNLVWHKDGQVLQDSLRTTVTGSDVQILNLQRSDGGTYSCTFTNPVGEVSQLIKLVVEGSPFITISPRNTTAVEGQRVKFSCSAEAFPANITYYWYKDGTSVRDLNVFDKRLTLTPDGGLLLTGVVKDDMGWYTCKPSNSIGHDEASAYLNVTYFPRVIKEQMPSQVIWAKNFQQSLDCPVDANPPRTNTIWSKGQTILESKGRLDILLNGTLLVSGVLETDAGSYSCTPVSALGYGQPSPNVQVLVKDPPYFTVRPALLYQKQVDESVVMVCAASGTPSPFIEWKKVEGIIDISSGRISQNGGNLSISRTVKEDHGKYECIASNTIATIIASTELHILNTTPHAPYNVTVVPSYFSADVSWEPAYDGGRPQFYMLWFRQSGGSWNQLTIPVQATSFTVYTLQPNTNYDFMVLSRNDLGNGSFSDVVAARTLDPDHKARPRTTLRTMGYDPSFVTALPIGADGVTYIPDVKESYGPQPTPPRNVTAVRQEDGSILVTWQSPLDPPVPVFWYTVEYRPFGSQIWQRYEGYVLSTAGNRKLMKDLDPGTYQVKVVAYGVMAFSPTSNVATVEIPSNHQSRTIPSNAEPGSDSRLIPEAMIGGIVGGVLFLLVAVLLTTMAIIHSRRKDSKARNAANYVDVNYGKPEEENNIHIQSPSKRDRWQQNGGGDIVTSLANTNSIFFLPDSHKVSDQNSMFRDPRFDDRDFRGRFPDATYQVPKSPPTSSDGQNAYPPNYYKPHSPLTAHDSYPLASNRNYLPDLNTSRVRSHSQPPEHFGSRSLGPDSTDFSYPESKSLPRYPKSFGSLQRPEGKSFGQQPELPLSYLGDKYLQHYPSQSFDGPYQSFQSEDDDVFDQGSHLPSSGPAGLPRHSSMKPASQQTYLVGDELGNTLEDISSVLDTPQEQYFHPSRKDLKTHPWQQPSLDLSKVIPVGSASGDVNLEGHSPTRDKPLARVWPSPKYAEENNVSSDSSGHPLGYTRDQLHTVVDRLRQVPRQWPTPGSQYLDVSDRGNKPSDGPSVRLSNIQRDRDTFVPGHSSLRMTAPYLGSNLDHFIPPPPHAPHFPEDSHSSGIGSRNTSQSTSSSRPRFKPSAASVSSLMTPQELSHSEDSAYFPRDTSTDENYEFDHLPALESDILNDLHHYSRLSGIKPGEQVSDSRNVLQGLYPKPSKKSQYADAAERFEKLREEFQQYRQHNQSSSLTSPSFSRYAENQQPLYPMDSEML